MKLQFHIFKKTIPYSLFVTGLIIFVHSAIVTYSDLSAGPLRNLAGKLEAGQKLPFKQLSHFKQLYESDAIGNCSLTDLRAALSLHLNRVDAANKENVAPLEADDSYQIAIKTSKKLLQCSPSDGNAWIRLAMLEVDVAGPTTNTQQMVEYSYWTAPNEGWILKERLRFLSRLVTVGVSELNANLERDARIFAGYASVREISEIYKGAGLTAQRSLLGVVDYLPREKRNAIHQAVGIAVNAR